MVRECCGGRDGCWETSEEVTAKSKSKTVVDRTTVEAEERLNSDRF